MRRLPCLVLSLAALLPGSVRAADDTKALASKAMGVLDKYCASCHGIAKLSGDLDVRDHKSLLSKTKRGKPYVTPKDAAKSYIWTRIENEEMPPNDEPQLSAQEKQTLKAWIEADAPPPAIESEKPRQFISFKETITAIRDHMRAVDKEDQPYQRYFVMTHAHNDESVKEADLRIYRAALSKAINSLSWKRGIVLPKPVGNTGAIFAIDLRDLDWDRKPGEKLDMWQAMMKYYPYGLGHTEDDDRDIATAAGDIATMSNRKLVYMRADWFVATATRPPLYHTILRLPDNAYDLEKKLGVDVVANFKRGRLWRAGFMKSGVSAQNRLVERHDALYGAYWKSYDFKKGNKKGNLLDYPLGPDFTGKYGAKYPYADAAFVHDGGEMVFNLPNGLQGYFLVDGKDRRIDSGPEEVVSDYQRTSGTPAIVTGVSCMACHSKGLIYKDGEEWDDVRFGVTLSGAARLKVRQLFPVHKTVMIEKMEEDAELYRAALEKATGKFLFTKDAKEKEASLSQQGEPVGKWARKYRLIDPGLSDIAAELGMKPEKLRLAIESNAKLRELGLAILLKKGGVVKRADWEYLEGGSLYQRVCKELGLGDPWSPE